MYQINHRAQHVCVPVSPILKILWRTINNILIKTAFITKVKMNCNREAMIEKALAETSDLVPSWNKPLVLSSRTDFFVDISGQISSRPATIVDKTMVRK